MDIEAIDRKVTDSLIRYAMNDEEQAKIAHSIDRNRTFFRLWTQKEAVAKLLGIGIQGDRIKDLLNANHFHIETQEYGRHVVSIATSPYE
ncbi:MAG: 4'-phosphopantetheinyl transferase superfamily protein [Bacteroidaceae bacterium]|nr:4'-phosphopantetheinyl transferase superfamily protein [Bacteroidaceae bacterium]